MSLTDLNLCHREERDAQWSEKRAAIDDFEGKELNFNEEITQLEVVISQIVLTPFQFKTNE